MNDFDALLGELATMSKAQTMEGSKVMAAAKEGGADMPDASGKQMTEEEEEAEREKQMMKGGEDDDDMMGKSFAVTMEDGSTQEAYDGTAMLKSMGLQITALSADRDFARGELTKALTASAKLAGLVKHQGEMVKALSTRIETLASSGRGRQAAVMMVDKPGLVSGGAAAPNGNELMAKAMTAFREGKIGGDDIARIEAHLGRNLPVPSDITERLA